MYDIIGDVHGHATLLRKLLKKLGYKKNNGVYSHKSRIPVFVGDFINRGPEVRETVNLVRGMVEAGNAHALLGNHELNALICYLKDDNGKFIVNNNLSGSIKTEKAFALFPEEWKSHRQWMRTLPFYFEKDNIRVIHACWIDENIEVIKELQSVGRIKKSLLHKIYSSPDSIEGKSIWQSTKGLYFNLPADLSLRNNQKRFMRSYRIKWWESAENKTFDEISFESKVKLPDYTIPSQIIPDFKIYPDDAPPVFFGHYCRGNGPYILRNNVCCLDSCITNTKSILAYSWHGETKLEKNNLVLYSKKLLK